MIESTCKGLLEGDSILADDEEPTSASGVKVDNG